MGPELLEYYNKKPGELMDSFGPSQDELMGAVEKANRVSSFVKDINSYYQNRPEESQEDSRATKESELAVNDTTPEPKKRSNPYDSIINYPEEEKRIQDRVTRQKEYEQKIARTNALGEALKVLVEGAGAIGGATIKRREPSNIGLRALDNMRALEAEERDRLDRLRMLKLNNAVRNIDYQVQQDRIADENKRRDQEKAADRDFAIQQQEADRKFKVSDREDEQAWRDNQLKTQHGYNMNEIKARGEQYNNRSNAKDAWSFNDPASGKEVSIDPTTNRNLLYLLDQMYPPGNIERPRELTGVLRGEMVRTPAVEYLIQKNWPMLEQQLSAMKQGQLKQPLQQEPEVYEPAGELSGRMKRSIRKLENAGMPRNKIKQLSEKEYEIELNNLADNKDLADKDGIEYSDRERRLMIEAMIREYEGASEEEAKRAAEQYIPKPGAKKIVSDALDLFQ